MKTHRTGQKDSCVETLPAKSAKDATRQALSGVMKLIEDGDLVRNIENDGDVMTYMKQGLRIALALQLAEQALDMPVTKVESVLP